MKMIFWNLIAVCSLGVAVALLTMAHLLLLVQVQDQQRQIDQFYAVMPSLIQRGVASEQWKFYDYNKLPDGKYKMYFADYRTDSAILIHLDSDPTKRHEKEPTYIYATNIPKGVLNTWTHGEVRRLPPE